MVTTKWEIADINLFYYDEDNNWDYAFRVYRPLYDFPDILTLKTRVGEALKKYYQTYGIEIIEYHDENITIGVQDAKNKDITTIKLFDLYDIYTKIKSQNKLYTSDEIAELSLQLGFDIWLAFGWQQRIVIEVKEP